MDDGARRGVTACTKRMRKARIPACLGSGVPAMPTSKCGRRIKHPRQMDARESNAQESDERSGQMDMIIASAH